MAFLDFLSGSNQLGGFQGVDINKKDFEIKDADKLFGQTQEQYQQAAAQQPGLNTKAGTFLNTLEASAMGQGPSLSKEMLKQAQERNLQQQLAMAAGQRGGNPAAQQRELLRAQSAGAANVAQQGVSAGLQEQMQNRNLYQQELGRQQASVNELTQKYLAMGFDIRHAQEQALADYNRLNVQQALGLASANQANQAAAGGMTGALMGGLIKAGAAVATPKGSGSGGG